MNRCANCGGQCDPRFAVCWKCKQKAGQTAAREQGYVSGYRDGYRDGLATSSARVASPLDDKRIRQLLQLCHPDKHSGSTAANEVTVWLLDQRK